MITNLKSPVKKNKDQDQIIQQIKTIALQIFNKPLFNLKVIDFEATGIFLQNYPKSHQKVHSFTQRKFTVDDQQCKSQWITYENIQQFDVQLDNLMQEQNKDQKLKQKHLESKIIKNRTKPQKIIQKKDKDKKVEDIKKEQSKKEQVKEKIKLQKLDQYGFMQQKGKLTQQAIQYIYHQKEKEKIQQNTINSKNTKTLEALYSEKQPLYDKFLKQKQKKLISIYQSRVDDQKKQIEMIKDKPEINKNIRVEGNFNQRLATGAKRAQQKKIKIINDMLKDATFQPRINNLKKFQKVESQVKKNWCQKNIDFQSLQLFQSSVSYRQMGKSSIATSCKQISGEKTKNNRSTNTGSNKSTFNVSNLKLSHASQLSNIFQIQDNTYQ